MHGFWFLGLGCGVFSPPAADIEAGVPEMGPAFAAASMVASPESNTTAVESFDLWVSNSLSRERQQEPTRGGIALPKGSVFRTEELRLLSPEGVPVPVQIHPLGLSWPDGSLKHVLVQFKADVPGSAGEAPGRAVYRLEVASGSTPPIEEIAISDGETLVVDTGPMSFAIDRGDVRLPNRVAVDGMPVVEGGIDLRLWAYREALDTVIHPVNGHWNDGRPRDDRSLLWFGQGDSEWQSVWGPTLADQSGVFQGGLDVEVEELGPLRAVVKISTPPSDEPDGLAFVARLYAYAGETSIRTELTLISRERLDNRGGFADGAPLPGVVANGWLVRELSVEVTPEWSGEVGVTMGRADGVDGSESVQVFDAVTAEPGWVSGSWADGEITLAAQAFWERYPKAIGLEENTLYLDLWPRQGSDEAPVVTSIPGGRARTWEYVVDFGGRASEEVSGMARAELHALLAPEQEFKFGAGFPVVPWDGQFPKYEAFERRSFAENEEPSLFGDVDFGDHSFFIAWNPCLNADCSRPAQSSRYNGYKGAAHSMLTKYRESGDPAIFRAGEAAVRHAMTVDTVNWSPRWGTPMLGQADYRYEAWTTPARETYAGRPADHLSLATSSGNNYQWWNDLVDHYFLTGERRVVDLFREIPNTRGFTVPIPEVGIFPIVASPTRSTAIPWLNLLYAWQVVGDEQVMQVYYPAIVAPQVERTDALENEAAARTFDGIVNVFRYMNGEQLPGFPAGVSFDLAEDPNPGLPDVYTTDSSTWGAAPANLQTQGAIMAGYPAEAFFEYHRLTGDPAALLALTRVGEFQAAGRLPLGTFPYDRRSDVYRFLPMMHEVSGTSAWSALANGDPARLATAAPAAEWVLYYEQIGHYMHGTDNDLPDYVYAMRHFGVREEQLRLSSVEVTEGELAAATAVVDSTVRCAGGSCVSSLSQAACELGLDVVRVRTQTEGPVAPLQWLLSKGASGTIDLTYCRPDYDRMAAGLCAQMTDEERNSTNWPPSEYQWAPCP